MKVVLLLNLMFLFVLCSFGQPISLTEENPADFYRPVNISGPEPGDLFREYTWTTEKFHVLSLDEKPFDIPGEIDLNDAIKAEIVMEIANQHMGFEDMAIRINGNKWYPIGFPELSPVDPSPSLWFHHWYPTIPVVLTDIKSGSGNTFEMNIPARCFDGNIYPNGDKPLYPWCPVYGVTLRVYYDPDLKDHPDGRVLIPAAERVIGLSAELKANIKSDRSKIRQVDFIGRYEDINYQGDGVYYQWQYNLFHGKITNHLGSAFDPDSSVIWNTEWVPDQPGLIDIVARITDNTGLIYMTEAISGLRLDRPGLSVELCKPFNVPRSFTSVQYGVWVIPGVRSEKFAIKGDIANIIDARYIMASWGDQKGCHGYSINGVQLQDNPGGENWLYNLTKTPVRPINVLRHGENTFSTVVGEGRMPDIYLPGVQILIRYKKE